MSFVPFLNQSQNLNCIKMKTVKMSLANIQGKLSRAEMKQIMAGSGAPCSSATTAYDCSRTGDSNNQCCWSGQMMQCLQGITTCA